MRGGTELPPVINVDVTANGVPPDAVEYARSKVGGLARFTHRPVLNARVKLSEHRDPAVERPVTAQANLNVNGRLVRAQVQAGTAREAIDRLEATLRHRLEREGGRWDARARAAEPTAPQEWRHESEPADRPNYFPRPADERRVIRRKSFAMQPCTVDEALAEMELLGYDFHLFIEKGTAASAVVYRSGPTGYRVALVAPELSNQLSPFDRQVTISPQPTPCLTESEAKHRLGLLGLPFLFYIDADHGCASILYHRYDGHYGVITPAG